VVYILQPSNYNKIITLYVWLIVNVMVLADFVIYV